MQFPKESYDWAEEHASQLKKLVGTNKRSLARGLYKNLNIDYGYEGAIDSELWLRYPHELNNAAECVESGAARFVMAKVLGLKPKLYVADELTLFGGNSGHIIVDGDTGNKSRTIIDPVSGLYGPVTYGRKELLVKKNPTTSKRTFGYSQLTEIDEDLFVRMFEYYRSTEGAMEMIQAGQRVHQTSMFHEFIHYDQEKKQAHFEMQFFRPFNKNISADLIYQIGKDGKPEHTWSETSMYSGADWHVKNDGTLLCTTQNKSAEQNKEEFNDFDKMYEGSEIAERSDCTKENLEHILAYGMYRLAKDDAFVSLRTMKDYFVKPKREELKKLKAKNTTPAEDNMIADLESFFIGLKEITSLKTEEGDEIGKELYSDFLKEATMRRKLTLKAKAANVDLTEHITAEHQQMYEQRFGEDMDCPFFDGCILLTQLGIHLFNRNNNERNKKVLKLIERAHN